MAVLVDTLRRVLADADRRHVWTGVISGTVIGVILLAAAVIPRLGVGSRDITVEFAQAAGIAAGDPVRVAGIDVGTVGRMRLAGNRVVIDLQIHHDVPVGAETRADIKLSTLLGARYVDLRPAGPQSPPVHRIPLSHSAVPYDLQKTIETGQPLVERVDGPGIAAGLDAMTEALRTAPDLAGGAIDAISTLSGVINTRRAQVASLLRNADTVTTMLADNRSSLNTMVTAGGELVGQLVTQRDLVERLLTSVRGAATQLGGLLTENIGKVDPLVAKLESLAQGLSEHQAGLTRLFEQLPPAVRQIANATGNGNYVDVYYPWGLIPDNWLCSLQLVGGCR
ncbi:MCE family protein [Williamsia sp. SKLECPSW1]